MGIVKNLHSVGTPYAQAFDDAVRAVLRDNAFFNPGWTWGNAPEHIRPVHVPRYGGVYDDIDTDPLRLRTTFNYETVDIRALLQRLNRNIDRLAFGLTGVADDYGVRISRTEERALLYFGHLQEGALRRYRGVRLFIDG
jgi:hypothetical protein